jgi:zinc transport system substrate-binding protein
VRLITLLACLVAGLSARAEAPKRPLIVGVTLHPYYSWTKAIVGDTPGVEVRGVIPGEVDASNYQPSPDDIKKLGALDALVVNGTGHDDFIFDMVKASGNKKLVVIRPNDETPLLRSVRGDKVNSHTFLSFSNAISQTYFIEKKLAELRPEYADAFRKNAAEYAKRLRKLKAEFATQLADARISRVVTVHDGYSYLLQEFGLSVAGVVEPAHALVPSAKELTELVALLKAEKIKVVFSEESFPDKLLKVLENEAGVRVYLISHIASGPWSELQFEQVMKANAQTLVQALVVDAK